MKEKCDKVYDRKEKSFNSYQGQVSLAAKAADCKSVTSETTLVRVQPCPFYIRCDSGLYYVSKADRNPALFANFEQLGLRNFLLNSANLYRRYSDRNRKM